ncbi:MAG TPA: hypothetical protein VMR41_05995 [Patescibacteria group bacterium]|nr:hypothetical protein [Patescibacteria group bacterium]
MLDKYSVFRPLNKGRIFNFFHKKKVSLIAGTEYGIGVHPQLSWKFKPPDGIIPEPSYILDNEFNLTTSPFRLLPSSITELLFSDAPVDVEDTSLQFAKFPELFSYSTALPVYYGFRLRLSRAYIQLTGDFSDVFLPTSSDVQFAQNQAENVDVDLFYYFDSQNFNKVYPFLNSSEHFYEYVRDGRFTRCKSSCFDINVGCELPDIFSVKGEYEVPFDASMDSVSCVQNMLENNVSSTVGTFHSPGYLYVAPVMPLTSNVFKQLFIQDFSMSPTLKSAYLCLDFELITKLSLSCSLRLPAIVPWSVYGGKNMPYKM